MRMKKAGAACLIAALAAGMSESGVAAAPASRTLTCTMTTVTDARGMHINVDARIWVKGQRARVELSQPGGGRFLALFNGNHEWRLDPAQKRGVAITHPPGEIGPQGPIDLIMAKVKQLTQGARKQGQQKLGGYTCDVYELNHRDPGGTESVKSWITRTTQPRLPIKIVLRSQIRQPNMTIDQTTTTHLENLRFGVPLPDSLFQVPPGYKIVQAPTGGGPGMPGVPGMSGAGSGPRP